ncbi:bifunctional DNA-formamidopyrimidine glycosylase/DNA-(apurinic or apyrimidinic site) lyase [Pseudoxanthobacter sp.]|uniref:bifunctional DNA-formamidopyrimidine glycosylase/DNA-(apurinic or apyrimidinic site) lyase n=1 Tax=Pseudoxanthobacter sp. TaxID=1925742 RepID=UPI002FE35B36
MPELPEVETVRRGLAPVMEGRRILSLEVRRPDLRFPFPEGFAARLAGCRIAALDRRAKYLLMRLEGREGQGPQAVILHLGMSGSFRIETGAAAQEAARSPGAFHHPRAKAAAHDHVVFHMEGGMRVTYNDPRRFGFMVMADAADPFSHPLLAGLGIEPLGNELAPERLAQVFAGRSVSLKAALLDQKRIAGLGNIYVCEALWRAGLAPDAPASVLADAAGRPTAGAARLAEAIRSVLTEAVAAGGSTLRDHIQADGSLGYFQHTFAVYDREGAPCPRCGAPVERMVQNGRSTFFCAACQRPAPARGKKRRP